MKKIKTTIAECLLRIAKCKLVKSKKLSGKIAEKLSGKIGKSLLPNNYSLVPNKPVPPNTLTTFPNYLKKPIRFWSTNVGDEIRSSFDVELYEKVCQAKGLESGVQINF